MSLQLQVPALPPCYVFGTRRIFSCWKRKKLAWTGPDWCPHSKVAFLATAWKRLSALHLYLTQPRHHPLWSLAPPCSLRVA
jgi:hypothetical protein